MKNALRWTLPIAALGACLTGCSTATPVDAKTDAEVRAYFEKDGHPAEVDKLWLAGSADSPTVCGRMEPAPEGTRHRFYYDRVAHQGQVELSEKAISTTMMTNALAAQNRELFNNLWTDHCEPAEPTF